MVGTNSIPYIHSIDIHNTDAANEILPTVLTKYSVNSIVDFGSGLCTWLKVARELGINDVKGIDGDWVDVKKITIPLNQFIMQNLTEDIRLGRKFDLGICLEVAEHLPGDCADTLMDNIVRHSDLVLWSAAMEGQGGQNHVNEHDPSYWHNQFRRRGFCCEDSLRPLFWENENIEWWYRQNILIYRRRGDRHFEDDDNSCPRHYVHPLAFREKNRRIEVLEKRLMEVISGRAGVGFYFKILTKCLLQPLLNFRRR